MAVANSVRDCLSFVQAQEQFWEICLGGGGEQLSPIFLERRARGEGSSRRFFGREFAEPAACEGRLAKGSKLRKNTKKPSKKVRKRVKNGTLEAPGSPPGAILKKVPHSV